MKQEIACKISSDDAHLRVESIPFGDIPGQSPLFLKYQSDPLSLSKYYPSAVRSHTEIAERVPDVLAHYETDRQALCDALERINRSLGSGSKTAENIELLRKSNTVAVVTGQQAGVFTGPLYTIYKALSAIKMSACLRDRGFSAVPVFWAATEDHDFEEVSITSVVDRDSRIRDVLYSQPDLTGEPPVGDIVLDEQISETIRQLLDAVPAGEWESELKEVLTTSWSAGTGFGKAFGRNLLRLLGRFGLVILDPLEPDLKRLAAPIYVSAIQKSESILSALRERSAELERDGFEPQVTVTEDHFPMFIVSGSGDRTALKITPDGTMRVKGSRTELTLHDLEKVAATEPHRLSPGVLLRPVVQDSLLPTVCYYGGGAEIAYFAQISAVYEELGRPVTPILHRQSFTAVEARHARTMDRYDIGFRDLFLGSETVLADVASRSIARDTASVFARAEEAVNTELNRLDQHLDGLDPTLSDNLATRRRKILYHIGALRKKAYFARLRSEEDIHRRLDAMFASLLPKEHLQERSLNVSSYLARYGTSFIDWIYASVDLDDRGHRVIYFER